MGRFASFVLFCLLLIPAAARADDQVAMVQGQIQMAQERLAAYQGELSSTLSLLQKTPSDATFQKIRDLQDRIRRQGNVVDTLRMALQDARAAQSWSAMVSDMARNSTILGLGADIGVSVYQSGKWIFGATDDELYGENWQQVESYNAKLVAEARAIRDESKAILGALDQVKAQLNAGGSEEQLRSLAETLSARLRELQTRGEQVKKNIRLLIRIYRAEKENLPASTLFHGVFMGRYTEKMVEEFDASKLVDLVIDVIKGDTNDALIKLIKPMVKTAVGDYLAKNAGGGHLTPEITDDLVFKILFGGESGFDALIQDRLGDEAGGAAIKGLVKEVVAAEANHVILKSNQQFYGAMKRTLSTMPPTADIVEHNLVVDTTDQLVKEHKSLVENGARAKAQRLAQTGEAIKKVWDLVLKDAVQAYLQKDSFNNAVKAANEACVTWREEWRKVKDDMILTEDEYVNHRWFKGGQNAAAPPKQIVGGTEDTGKTYAAFNPEEAGKLLEARKRLVESGAGQEGGGTASLGEFDTNEEGLVGLACNGGLPLGRVGFVPLRDVRKLTSAALIAPCDELSKRRNAEIDAGYKACEHLWNPQTVNDYFACKDAMRVKSNAYSEEINRCIDTHVTQPQQAFAQRRLERHRRLNDCETKRYQETLKRVQAEIAPAVSWAESVRGDVERLQEAINKLRRSGLIYPETPPRLPADIGKPVDEEQYDSTAVDDKLAMIRANLAITRGIDVASIENALARADFVVDPASVDSGPIPYLCKEFVLNNQPGIEEVEWTGCYYAQDEKLLQDMALINTINPSAVQELVSHGRQLPEVANRPLLEAMADFSPQESVNLYRQGMNQRNRARAAIDGVNSRLLDVENVLSGSSVAQISLYYDYQFTPWKVRRIPTLLGQDLDALEGHIREMRTRFNADRQVVIPDYDALRREAEAASGAVAQYREIYGRYAALLTKHFPTAFVDEFSPPDLSGLVSAIDAQAFLAARYAEEFKRAATALDEMEREVQALRRQEEQSLKGLETYHRARAGAVKKAAGSCAALPADPEGCLKAVEESKAHLLAITLQGDVLAHFPSQKYRDRRDEILAGSQIDYDIYELEAKAKAAIEQRQQDEARKREDRETNAPLRIAEFYQQFRGAYEGRNDSQLISFLGDDWESGDGTTLADLQGYLRNSFSVFDEIRYTQSNLQIHPAAQGSFRVTYDLAIIGRIYAENLTHEEKSSVSEELAFDDGGKLRILRTTGGRFWSVQ